MVNLNYKRDWQKLTSQGVSFPSHSTITTPALSVWHPNPNIVQKSHVSFKKGTVTVSPVSPHLFESPKHFSKFYLYLCLRLKKRIIIFRNINFVRHLIRFILCFDRRNGLMVHISNVMQYVDYVMIFSRTIVQLVS